MILAKKRLDRQELDALTLAMPEARVAYEELKRALNIELERLKMLEGGTLTEADVLKRGRDQ